MVLKEESENALVNERGVLQQQVHHRNVSTITIVSRQEHPMAGERHVQ
jgi:hypothetical protein